MNNSNLNSDAKDNNQNQQTQQTTEPQKPSQESTIIPFVPSDQRAKIEKSDDSKKLNKK